MLPICDRMRLVGNSIKCPTPPQPVTRFNIIFPPLNEIYMGIKKYISTENVSTLADMFFYCLWKLLEFTDVLHVPMLMRTPERLCRHRTFPPVSHTHSGARTHARTHNIMNPSTPAVTRRIRCLYSRKRLHPLRPDALLTDRAAPPLLQKKKNSPSPHDESLII